LHALLQLDSWMPLQVVLHPQASRLMYCHVDASSLLSAAFPAAACFTDTHTRLQINNFTKQGNSASHNSPQQLLHEEHV